MKVATIEQISRFSDYILDLEGCPETTKGGGGLQQHANVFPQPVQTSSAAVVVDKKKRSIETNFARIVRSNVDCNAARRSADMSVCLESSSSSVVLPAQVVGKLTTDKEKKEDGATTTSSSSASAKSAVAATAGGASKPHAVVTSVVTAAPAAAAKPKTGILSADLQAKVNANSSVITVVNAPITVVKSIGAGGVSSATPFALNQVAAATASPSTITLVNAPAKGGELPNNGLPVAPVNDKQGMHNVLVKKSAPAEGGGISVPDMPQSHKLLTANSFPPTNILQKLSPITKTQNGQRGGKVKVLGQHVVQTAERQNTAAATTANPGPSNVILNKNQRFFQQKIVGNGATKYLKPPSEVGAKRILFHGKSAAAVGALEIKPIPQSTVQHHRTGIKTIPPQRPAPGPNKPNYIGKHAVQAQKIKSKLKPKLAAQPQCHTNNPTPLVMTSPVRPLPDQSAQTIFNQALTAQILETLSDKECSKPQPSNSYGLKYEPCLPKPEPPPVPPTLSMDASDAKRRPVSTLDTLSFVCQAVLLDHNYNATLPPEPPPKPAPPMMPTTPPVNGAQHAHPHNHAHQQFSPIPNYPSNLPAAAAGKQQHQRNRTTSQSTPALLHTVTAAATAARDDDAASDISDHKEESEGEETDTAPEAEAVTNEANDRYGDYVTRCICGFIHDDGFMIECDKCKVWQHVRCVVKPKKVPDDYSCEECDPRPVDKAKARALQQQWMREVQERDAKLRKEQLAMSDSDSSDNEAHNSGKGRRKEPPPRRQRRDSLNNRARPGTKRKERKVPTKRVVKPKPPAKSDDEKVPQIRQWIENYEEAMTNHYSPDLRSRISTARLNGAHSEIPGGVDLSVNKCRVQAHATANVKFLVASVSLPMGTPVIELRGKYMLSTQHRSTTRQQRPGPFLFFHTLIKDTEVCVDTRTYGNCARFVRRSCTPNAKLQHVFEKGILHLFIVTTKSVEKGSELTIRHESHDLAAAQLTEVPCACVNTEYCALIKGYRRHNGDLQSPPLQQENKRRRGRHSREPLASPVIPPPLASPAAVPPEKIELDPDVKEEVKLEEVEIKKEEPEVVPELPEVKEKEEIKKEVEEEVKEIKEEVIEEEPPKPETPVKSEVKEEDENSKEAQTPRQARHISTRRASRHSQEQAEPCGAPNLDSDKKPMSREERKMAAIVRAIERLEKQELRRQEHQAKQANRREPDATKDEGPKSKRKKRKGRARTTSTNSTTRRNRLDSADSVHSSDDTLLSPPSEAASPSKAAGMLLSLANGECRKSPDRLDSSNSAHSSPETPLSAACLMVAAAVEPLEPGFKFPKTKKVLMNEWLNKSDVVQPASAISPSALTPHIETPNNVFNSTTITVPPPAASPAKCLNALAQAATFCDQPRSGSAKKRWLRQAISEDQIDSPPQADAVAPPKKRKLPRESLSCESSPPTTPTTSAPPQVEIINHQDDDGGTTSMESDATLSELATEMRQEYGPPIMPLPTRETTTSPPIHDETMETRIVSLVTTPSVETTSVTPTLSPIVNPTTTTPSRAIMDPRLAPRISTSELVGTVEKTLSFLGYEEKKQSEAITPAKRKLSITEYRQRKKLNNNDKSATSADDVASITEESNSSQSPKLLRTRSNSASSVTSASTSDDEQTNSLSQSAPVEVKALSAFNSEPTELERQRESATLRLKRALGLTLDNQQKNIVLNVETILKNELPTPTKTLRSLASPNFPIPGRDESLMSTVSTLERHSSVEEPSNSSPPRLEPEVDYDEPTTKITKAIAASMDEETQDGDGEHPLEERKVLYYTPDDEEVVEGSTYVPPFNNPLYPNTSYTYGSVIDDDAPYEGRNPSPPPNLRANPS